MPDVTGRQRRRVAVRGVVQGVGFRPHVYSLATSLDLAGAVWNDSNGVVVEVEGDPVALDAFCLRVVADAPPLAVVESSSWTVVDAVGGTSFTVRGSETGPGSHLRLARRDDLRGLPGRPRETRTTGATGIPS